MICLIKLCSANTRLVYGAAVSYMNKYHISPIEVMFKAIKGRPGLLSEMRSPCLKPDLRPASSPVHPSGFCDRGDFRPCSDLCVERETELMSRRHPDLYRSPILNAARGQVSSSAICPCNRNWETEALLRIPSTPCADAEVRGDCF